MKQTKLCDICGEAFSFYASRQKNARFCSVSCKGKFARSLQDQSGANNPAWKGGVWRVNTIAKAKEWNQSNPEKRRAHHAVEGALKSGKLIKEPCGKCGSQSNVDGHHHDYDKPFEVEWLCRSCHLKEHRHAA